MAQTTCEAEKGELVEVEDMKRSCSKKNKKLTIPSLRSQKYNRKQGNLPESIFRMPGREFRYIKKVSHPVRLLNSSMAMYHWRTNAHTKPEMGWDRINWQITNTLRIFFGVYPAATPYVGLVGD